LGRLFNMKPDTNFRKTLSACQDFGFGLEITAEQCWNEGYRLGRRRWYWGPGWFVSFQGWVKTQLSKLRGRRSL
jgi:hypothetical protein